jgi:hypothetical protein
MFYGLRALDSTCVDLKSRIASPIALNPGTANMISQAWTAGQTGMQLEALAARAQYPAQVGDGEKPAAYNLELEDEFKVE